jgi:hypothetical protein
LGLLKFLNEEEELVGEGLNFFLFNTTCTLLEAAVPQSLFIGDLVCCIYSNCTQYRWFFLKEGFIEKHKVTEHLGYHFLVLPQISYASISLLKSEY